MKVKLLEHYQDAGHIFAPGQEVDTDDVLGAWLVKHGKAIELEAKPDGPTVVTPEPVEPDIVPDVEEKPKAKRGKK